MRKITNSKDLIMLLLYAPISEEGACEPIVGQTRLMKMIFLFQEELAKKFALDELIDAKAFPDFEAFDYGPYAGQVYADLEFLVNYGFVELQQATSTDTTEEERQEFDYWSATGDADEDIDTTRLGRAFCVSARGRDFVAKRQLWECLTENQRNAITEFKKRCTSTTLRSLLRYVYTKYPKMTKKSVIKHEILN